METIQVKYRRLREKFNSDPKVCFSSSISSSMSHPALSEMIEMGEDILPFLLEDLRSDKEAPLCGTSDPERSYPWLHAPEVAALIIGSRPSIPKEEKGRTLSIYKHYAEWMENQLSR